MIEIERKFLVKNDAFIDQSTTKKHIAQGYLNSDPLRTVRVRTKGDQAFLTIKGQSSASGLSRFEWEKEVAVEDAKALLLLCESGIIEKTRYEIYLGKHTFEVDVFHGANDGLIIAEIELETETELFEIPDWLGIEVTGDKRYYNSYLSQLPFSSW
ncbi:CYTH domain-containing protein [Flavobacterium turcicum]|uniref:CYTH domain-containing protein n=1 Tax=Flavobacterium turcicum TaxID=2764718 RepID=A0ABR7JCC3_9FLAO|nr:CYTH domain-containing protein [Flavobacterium turcicum]MBC5862137.1 CYTH domain-containing protein [Flavobacterium turcicum]NHL00868.1 CYTH domain-containing protein [Flavobacterium turcicum]